MAEKPSEVTGQTPELVVTDVNDIPQVSLREEAGLLYYRWVDLLPVPDCI